MALGLRGGANTLLERRGGGGGCGGNPGYAAVWLLKRDINC